jgi:hypothetical protein
VVMEKGGRSGRAGEEEEVVVLQAESGAEGSSVEGLQALIEEVRATPTTMISCSCVCGDGVM